MLLALILVGAVTLLLCWLLLTLASLALPLFVGVAACHLAWQSGAGLMGSLVLSALAGGATLFAGQFLVAMLRGAAAQAAIRLVFRRARRGRGIQCGPWSCGHRWRIARLATSSRSRRRFLRGGDGGRAPFRWPSPRRC